MALEYRHDPDLEFLGSLDRDALDPLVDILTKGKDGTLRRNQNLTSESLYKEHAPNHAKYWHLIAAELQTWHGHALWNRWRGVGDKQGVLYRDILCDVCDNMQINYNKNSETDLIETYLLQKIWADVMEKMTPEQLREIAEGLNLRIPDVVERQAISQAIVYALRLYIRSRGFLPYKSVVVLANSVYNYAFAPLTGSGLSLAANAALPRSLSRLVGPVASNLMVLWATYEFVEYAVGPAYRVTRPAVIMVAYLRAQWRHDTESPNEATE